VIQRQVENQISKRLLAGEFAGGDAVRVDRADGGYTFAKAEPASAAA
jgi:hypothetical protein